MTTNSRPSLLSNYNQPRRHQIFEGTKKILYEGTEPGTYILFFKDECTDSHKKVVVNGKGILSNRISELFMSRLNNLGLETHFIRTLNMREQLVRATETLPFVVTIHNVASGEFARRLGLEENMVLPKLIPEFSLRGQGLDNPVVATEHLTALGWSRLDEIDDILLISQRVNDFLTGQFLALNIRLISVTLEFGRFYTSDFMESQIMLIDEIGPDTCNLIDLLTGQRLDRQGVHKDPEKARTIYQNVAQRLGILSQDLIDKGKTIHIPKEFSLKVEHLLASRKKK
jgi:phosphoribosylaminoimidazole-succinocarboxamide synthase